MRYEQTKIYFDGSHYVGISHTTVKRRFRPKPKTERFYEDGTPVKDPFAGGVWTELTEEEKKIFPDAAGKDKEGTGTESPEKKGEVRPVRKRITKRGEFFRLYEESRELSAKERKGHLIKNLRKFFRSDAETEEYVGKKLKDKRRALIARRIRFTRKAQLNEFNYFVTFTYDSQKHTEESFKKKLLYCLGHLHTRKGWKYMGVWERAPRTKRLHFHGLIYAPEGTMPGEMIKKRDYNLNTHRMQTTIQNTYFNERFGRSDFESVVRVPMMYDRAVGYILKYIEKTGEKLVYSRGTPMYLIADVDEKDVLTRMGEEGRKLLLFDNFECWEGDRCLGRVNEGGKERAKKGN